MCNAFLEGAEPSRHTGRGWRGGRGITGAVTNAHGTQTLHRRCPAHAVTPQPGYTNVASGSSWMRAQLSARWMCPAAKRRGLEHREGLSELCNPLALPKAPAKASRGLMTRLRSFSQGLTPGWRRTADEDSPTPRSHKETRGGFTPRRSPGAGGVTGDPTHKGVTEATETPPGDGSAAHSGFMSHRSPSPESPQGG